MKKLILLTLLIVKGISFTYSQHSLCSNRSFKEIESDFNKELDSIRIVPPCYSKTVKWSLVNSIKYRAYKRWLQKNPKCNINTSGVKLVKYLLEAECATRFEKGISSNTQSLISLLKESPSNLQEKTDDLYVLVQLERALNEDTVISFHLKEKLINAVSKEMVLFADNEYPYYTYNTKNKKIIKFISIRSGNDLFTLAGLFSVTLQPANKYVNDGNIIFQRNDDRDYTGSVLIEVGSDYFNTRRRRPLKTYQTVLYGFDVYTPYFSDTLKFANDTAFNILDRPHASFQYFGWSKKGISRGNTYRWATIIKVGRIGGDIGGKFQNVVHQDVSNSPRPRGWAAQIANGGRLGISLEFEQGFLQRQIMTGFTKNLWVSAFAEEKIGSYMSNASLGLRLSNKSFRQNNHNFINHRKKQIVNSWLEHFMYAVSFSSTYVQHNTMLEGYGFFNSIEEDNDALTPESKYFLRRDQVRRFTYLLNVTISYTARYGTFFYNWKSISPETYLSNIGVPSLASGNEMNIGNRWHHFAELGITFNLH